MICLLVSELICTCGMCTYYDLGCVDHLPAWTWYCSCHPSQY